MARARRPGWASADALRRFRDGFHAGPGGRRTETLLTAMDAALAAIEGRATDARTRYIEAQRLSRELGSPLWQAMIGLDIVKLGALEPKDRRRRRRRRARSSLDFERRRSSRSSTTRSRRTSHRTCRPVCVGADEATDSVGSATSDMAQG